MRPVPERRGVSGTTDSGVRTRRTDHLDTPNGLQEWVSTFNLRWAEYLKHIGHNGRPQAA